MKKQVRNIMEQLLKQENGIRAGKTLLLILAAGFLWGFAAKRQNHKVVNEVKIDIENEAENHFVDEEQIRASITVGKNNLVYMRWLDSISLNRLERKIEQIDFVKKAQVVHDLSGNLQVNVSLVKPIARISEGGSDMDRYLGSEGEILPTSEKYAAKVITFDGPGVRLWMKGNQVTDSAGKELVNLIAYINKNPFWKAQITHLYIDQKGEIEMIPQVGQHVIEFGSAENFKAKFEKLQAYYNRIVPVKGWSAYKRISVKFKNQIVCQKNL
jgi:cell division protein FtsQ